MVSTGRPEVDGQPGARPAATLNARSLLPTAAAVVVAFVLLLVAAPALPRLVVAVPAVLSVTAVCSATAGWLLWAHGRVDGDPVLPWMGVGYAVVTLAVVLNLAGFPTLAYGGGPLRSTSSDVAAVYLLWHLLVALFALVATARRRLAPPGHRLAGIAGAALVLYSAWGPAPMPTLIAPGGHFTGTYRVGLAIAAILCAAATWRWARAAGRRPSWPRAWITVALSLHTWEVVLYALAQRRFSPAWWASVGLRVAAFGALTGGLIAGLLAAHRALVRFSSEVEAVAVERSEVADALAAANAELESFAHVVAHDLRSPLAAAAGYVELVRSGRLGEVPPTAGELLDRAASQHARMGSLISDLLTYASVANAELEPEPIDLDRLAREVVTEREAEDLVRIEPLPSVVGDLRRLRQLLDNLVDNALKYVAEGVQPQVEISGISDDGRIRLTVDDNGIGIDPDMAADIFQPFVRSTAARQHYPGTGIGLAICQRVVEQHGGAISVEARDGGGSRFTVELPART